MADIQQVDALYDAAQKSYLEGDFQAALRDWQAALALAPGDFEIQKKLVQAHFALGDHEGGEAALSALREAWRTSADPAVQGTDEVVIDQLRVDGLRVYAYETLRPRSPELHYALTWRVFDAEGRVMMTAQLESSAYGREVGVPFVFGVNTPRGHATTGPSFSARPPYLAVREIAVQQIQKGLATQGQGASSR